MLAPRDSHPLPGQSKGPAERVIEFCRLQRDTIIITARNQDPAIIEQGRCVIRACRDHRAGRSEKAGRRIVKERGGEGRSLIHPASDQYFARLKESRGMPCPLGNEGNGLRFEAQRAEKRAGDDQQWRRNFSHRKTK